MLFKIETFSNKCFRWFLLGHLISFTGTWINSTALQWLVYKLTGSSFFLGLINFLSSVPVLILGFLSGPLIDKSNHKQLYILILISSIIPPLFLGILLDLGIVSFWKIALIVFFMGCIVAFEVPLRQIIVSEIVPGSLLTQALSLQSMSFNIARMLGPIIAGWLIERNLYSVCFYLNAISFLPFLYVIKRYFHIPKKTSSKKRSLKFSIKESISCLNGRDDVFKVIGAVASFSFFGASLLVLLPVIVDQGLKGGAKEFALASSCIGIGAIIGAGLLALRKSIKNKTNHLFFAILLLSISLLGIAFIKKFFLFLIFCLLIGVAFTNFIPIANSFLQENVELEIRGRIMSFFTMAFLGIYPFGTLFVGILAVYVPYFVLIPVYIFILSFLGFFLLFKNKQKIELGNVANL